MSIEDTLDETLDDVREAAGEFLNSDGRSLGHVVLGAAVTAGFALLATALATNAVRPRAATRQGVKDGGAQITQRPRGALSLILPAVFSATTLSALRVWNAPAAAGRNRTLGLWALAQGVNALWLAARPSSLRGQMAAAMTSAGLAAAFAHEARKLDEGAGRSRAGKTAAPTGARVRIANPVGRKVEAVRPTVH